MPSFRTLQPEDIHSKDTPGDPDDLVTIVDKSAELYLIDALSGVVPGAAFIGEEAVCENPALLDALSEIEDLTLVSDRDKEAAREPIRVPLEVLRDARSDCVDEGLALAVPEQMAEFMKEREPEMIV